MNHRMMYDGLIITYESAGLLFLILIWAFCLFDKLCKKVRAKMCCNIGLFLSIWVVVIVFGLLSEGLHSIIVLNNHQICQYKPNSGAFNIIINKASSDYINSLNLNVVEDPNNIYRFLCHVLIMLYRICSGSIRSHWPMIRLLSSMCLIWHLLDFSWRHCWNQAGSYCSRGECKNTNKLMYKLNKNRVNTLPNNPNRSAILLFHLKSDYNLKF